LPITRRASISRLSKLRGEAFARGDLFEAVPGQLFAEPCERTPAEVFQRLCKINPSPYGALINLGDGEFLVAASPEMFVRSDGKRIETCPISGTIARGADAISDAKQIQELLNSQKDEFELNMCTDVDRNDKARVCEPGTIKVLARRQIETYSKLFHTVDHVEGMLRPGFDALDGFSPTRGPSPSPARRSCGRCSSSRITSARHAAGMRAHSASLASTAASTRASPSAPSA
jgi:anthranilate/para-aminobenzoate synthase component I